MNNSILNKSCHWLLIRWQHITKHWNTNSGKNRLLRAVLIALSLIYALFLASLFLAILPVVLISTALIALIVKSYFAKHHEPMTINMTPETTYK